MPNDNPQVAAPTPEAHHWKQALDYLNTLPETVAEYEASGEPDGCYWCGGSHHSSDCVDGEVFGQ